MVIISFSVGTPKSVAPFWSCCFCKTVFKSTVVISINCLCSLMLSVDESGQHHSFFPFYLQMGNIFFPWSLGFEGSNERNYFFKLLRFSSAVWNKETFWYKYLQRPDDNQKFIFLHCRFRNVNSQSNDLLTSFITAFFSPLLSLWYQLCFISIDCLILVH